MAIGKRNVVTPFMGYVDRIVAHGGRRIHFTYDADAKPAEQWHVGTEIVDGGGGTRALQVAGKTGIDALRTLLEVANQIRRH